MIAKRLFLLIPFAIALPTAAQVHPTFSKSPMTSDQVAVYGAFLTSYLHVDSTPGKLNLAKHTSLFDPLKEYEECLDGIRFEKLDLPLQLFITSIFRPSRQTSHLSMRKNRRRLSTQPNHTGCIGRTN
jgi:hypothetical protein